METFPRIVLPQPREEKAAENQCRVVTRYCLRSGRCEARRCINKKSPGSNYCIDHKRMEMSSFEYEETDEIKNPSDIVLEAYDQIRTENSSHLSQIQTLLSRAQSQLEKSIDDFNTFKNQLADNINKLNLLLAQLLRGKTVEEQAEYTSLLEQRNVLMAQLLEAERMQVRCYEQSAMLQGVSEQMLRSNIGKSAMED
jgi:hypothetical protein